MAEQILDMNTFADIIAKAVGGVVESNNENMMTMFEELKKSVIEASGQEALLKRYEGIFAGAKTITADGEKSHEPGIKLARWAKARIVATQENKSVASVIETMYAKDVAFVEEVKAISVGGDGGYLVPEDYMTEIIPLLYANTVVKKLGARIVPMPKGNINIPKLVSGSGASYIGENQKKNAANPKYANVKLSAKKLVAKAVMSNDILRSSDLSSDMYVRDDLVMQLQLMMDFAAIYGTGSDYMPRGIANTVGIQANASTAGLPTATNITAPIAAVEAANSAMAKAGWTFNSTFKWLLYNITDGAGNFIFRDELSKGLLLGHPFEINNQIPTGTTGKNTTQVFFGDWNDFMIGEQMSLEIKVSEDATYSDENGTTQSAFDNDQTVIKGMMIHDMAAARPQVFAKWLFDTIA